MKTRVYSILDKVAEEYGPLFEARNDSVAMRNYKKMIAEHDVEEDEFQLYYVCEIDKDDLKIGEIDPRRVVVNLNMEME